jgi:hypothetical protein
MPVHVTGIVGNTSEVIAASASNAATMPAHFILNETLADDAEGLAIAIGYINGVNTGDFSEGDTVYVGANGGYTNVKPTGSNLIQNLGIVDKVDASNGSGFVLGAGRSNDVPNISPGYAWVGKNNSVATAVATSSYSVTSSVVHLDESNGRVGINTDNPTYQLHVSSSTAALGVYERAGGAALFLEGQETRGVIGTVGSHPLLIAYNSGEVARFTGTSFLVTGSLDVSTSITASGNISASGTIVGSNLSGTNTGDQDLTPYVQNSQTSSMTVATASYVAAANIDGTIDISDQTNLSGGTNLTLSGDTMNLDANISLTNITASGNISASGTIFANLTAGTDNSVVIKTTTGELKTDEIDSRVWGSTLVDTSGTPTDRQLAVFTDANTVEGTTYILANSNNSGLSIGKSGTQSDNSIETYPAKTGKTGAYRSGIIVNSSGYTSDTTGELFSGEILYVPNTTSAAKTYGYIYYIRSSDGALVATDASAESTSEGMVGMAINAGKSGEIMTRGYATIPSANIGGTIATGSSLYIATSSGLLTTNPPSTTNHVVRKIGYIINPQGTACFVYFNPSNDYIVLA